MSDVSIIICTRNRIEDLTRCIQSIAAQQQLEHTAVELLIVDDGDISGRQVEQYRYMVSGLPQGVLKYHKKLVPVFGCPVMKPCRSCSMISCCILMMMPN
ncbi:glycosyltransferase family 2 protein [Paenibacillus farraposensis]|uniref:glycosyltransferase family 2 protein n=1 Tax=Paenibacillus farraposensis TaxID=2807095 RepID=UPI00361652DF